MCYNPALSIDGPGAARLRGREHVMKSRSLVVILAYLLPVAVFAQETAERGAGAGTAGDRQMSPRQLSDDVRLLRTLAQLELTTEQIGKIIPYVEQIRTHLNAVADRRAKTYGQQRTALENTRSALIQGSAPQRTTYDSIHGALRQLQLVIQVQMQKTEQVEANIQGELTERQLGRIEAKEQRDARLARVRELEGEATAAAYVVKKLKETRELLPDEYAGVRLRVANEIAVKTEGARSRRFNAYRQRVVAMMDEAYRWTVVEFQGRLPTLERSVATHLEIRRDADAPSGEGLIPYEEYIEALRNPRTPQLLREMFQRRGGGDGE